MLAADDSVLVLVDLQDRLMPAIHEGAAVVQRAEVIARAARILEIPVFATEQNPAGLGHTAESLAGLPEETIAKMHFDAMREDGLAGALPAGRETVVLAGCETHVCLFQSACGLLGSGRRVVVLVDAVGSRRPVDRDTALTQLRADGARLATVEQAIFEWLETAEHPKFREVLALVR